MIVQNLFPTVESVLTPIVKRFFDYVLEFTAWPKLYKMYKVIVHEANKANQFC